MAAIYKRLVENGTYLLAPAAGDTRPVVPVRWRAAVQALIDAE